jgi:hypothetical protein
MSLAVAVGAKSVSSRPIEALDAEEEQAEDGTLLRPVPVESIHDDDDDENDDELKAIGSRIHVTTCLSSDRQLQAVVTMTLYDMVWEDTQVQDCTVAAVRIQILPAYEAVSSRYRDSLHRIKLPVKGRAPFTRNPNEGTKSPEKARLVAVFSKNKRNLACVVPYPGSSDSLVVVFQLRRPRSESSSAAFPHPSSPSFSLSLPPLPSYIHQSTRIMAAAPTMVPIACNPRVLRETLNAQASDLEDAAYYNGLLPSSSSSYSSPSILLAGCCDGRILAISYRPLVLAGRFFDKSDTVDGRVNPTDEVSGNTVESVDMSISVQQLRHIADPRSQEDEKSTGRLVAVRGDGRVTIYRTVMAILASNDVEDPSSSFHASDPNLDPSERSQASHASFRLGSTASQVSLYLSIKPLQTLPGRACCTEWISSSYLALMQRRREIDPIYHGGRGESVEVQVWAVAGDGGDSSVLTSWEVTAQRLEETCHHSTRATPVDQSAKDSRIYFEASTFSLQFDSYSDCLAISAVFTDEAGDSGSQRSFVCIWNWRNRYEGLLVDQQQQLSLGAPPSWLAFARAPDGARRIIHTLAAVESLGPRIRKETYECEVLSCPSSRNGFAAKGSLRSNNILLGSTSISFPVAELVSSSGDIEMEWRDARIPLDYTQAHGAPRLAAIGKTYCRSVAVAGAHGLCVLDCGKSHLDQPKKMRCSSTKSRSKPRWYRFGSETEEGTLTVIAMTWWEGISSDDDDGTLSDLLVALIEVNDARVKGRYLACWMHSCLDFDHQLLVSDEDAALLAGNLFVGDSPRYGIKVPNNITPSELNVLVEPIHGDSPCQRPRKAAVLVADESSNASFVIYHLQVARWMPRTASSYKDMLPLIVLARLASHSSVGTASALFLASASFSFDLESNSSQRFDESDYIATLGVVRGPSGVDGIAFSSSNAIAFREVVPLPDLQSHSELVSCWIADSIPGNPGRDVGEDKVAWFLEMSNGDLHFWLAPYLQALPNSSINHESVLGRSFAFGKASFWMEKPGMGPRRHVSLASLPGECFGSVFGTEQVCRKMHRSLGEAFEEYLFRDDFLAHETMTMGDLVVSVPRFIPSVYALLSQSGNTGNGSSGDLTSLVRGQLALRMMLSPYRESYLASLQLLCLHAVEWTARSDERSVIIATFVSALWYVIGPLHFTSLILEVGRQMEPGLVPYLLPLQLPGIGEFTAYDLFRRALESGSISTAASALPLFDDHHELCSSGVAVLGHCLNAVLDSSRRRDNISFDFALEERLSLCDIFHYTLKLDVSEHDNFEDTGSSIGESGSDDASLTEPRGYSFTCGISQLFRRHKEDRFRLNGNGTSGIDKDYNHGTVSHTGFKLVSQVILREILSDANTSISWRRCFVIASLLIRDSVSGLDLCSADQFSRFLRETDVFDLSDILLASTLRSHADLFDLVTMKKNECYAALEPAESSILLDLFLILLGCPWSRGEADHDVAGLLLLAIVAGHHCGRNTDFIKEESLEHPLLKAFAETDL